MVNVQRKGTQDVPILDAQPILQSCHCERSAAISLQQKRFPRPGDGGVATLLAMTNWVRVSSANCTQDTTPKRTDCMRGSMTTWGTMKKPSGTGN